jgi:hypothetical protein
MLQLFLEYRAESMSGMKIKERPIPYADEENGIQGEPGLSVDIGLMNAVAAAFALALLTPESPRNTILDPDYNLVLFHSGSQLRGSFADIFAMPLDYIRARTAREERCEVCRDIA